MFKGAGMNLVKGGLFIFVAGWYEKYIEPNIKSSIQGALKTADGQPLGDGISYLLDVPKIGLQVAGGLQFVNVLEKTSGMNLEK